MDVRDYSDIPRRFISLTVISVSYDRDNLTKVYRLTFETEEGEVQEDIIVISVPPFNGEGIGPGYIDSEDFIAQ